MKEVRPGAVVVDVSLCCVRVAKETLLVLMGGPMLSFISLLHLPAGAGWVTTSQALIQTSTLQAVISQWVRLEETLILYINI